jgi:Ca2+-binding RTX toxin-like protein
MVDVVAVAPEPITVDNIWNLQADPGRILGAANGWRAMAAAAQAARDTVETPAAAVVGDRWSGAAADSYRQHQRRLGADVSDVGSAASAVSDALERVYHLIRTAQGALDAGLLRLGESVPYRADEAAVTFRPQAMDDVVSVDTAIAEAGQIRGELDAALSAEVEAIERAGYGCQGVTRRWARTAAGRVDGWAVPPEAYGTFVFDAGDGTVVVSGGAGDDTISVTADPVTGQPVVTVNGVVHRVSGGSLVIRGAGGRDSIVVAPGVPFDLTLIGGDGQDTLVGGAGDERILGLGDRDIIEAGDGRDHISGGAGADIIDGGGGADTISGGLHADVIHGWAGADVIAGGEGGDYLDGGAGGDTIDGDGGQDLIAGRDGQDTLRGGADGDELYAGYGRDGIDAGTGLDVVHRHPEDSVRGAEQVIITSRGDDWPPEAVLPVP